MIQKRSKASLVLTIKATAGKTYQMKTLIQAVLLPIAFLATIGNTLPRDDRDPRYWDLMRTHPKVFSVGPREVPAPIPVPPIAPK